MQKFVLSRLLYKNSAPWGWVILSSYSLLLLYNSARRMSNLGVTAPIAAAVPSLQPSKVNMLFYGGYGNRAHLPACQLVKVFPEEKLIPNLTARKEMRLFSYPAAAGRTGKSQAPDTGAPFGPVTLRQFECGFDVVHNILRQPVCFLSRVQQSFRYGFRRRNNDTGFR